jgi:hypothetical protein
MNYSGGGYIRVRPLFPVFVMLICLYPVILSAQETAPSETEAASVADTGAAITAGIPAGIGNMELGMEFQTAFNTLQSEPLFAFRGNPDVSLRPVDRQPLIQTPGRGFISSGIFQFRDDILYSITLQLDEDKIDYFTMYNDLSEKYGDPEYLDPAQAWWQSGSTRLIIEKPLAVKYLDMDVFTSILEEGAAAESLADYSLELFLNNF